MDSSASYPNTFNLTDDDFSKINKNLFNIGCYNINSITNGDRTDQLQNICTKLNLGILGIVESKLDETISPSNFSLPGYNHISVNRNCNGGGLICNLHESIP